MDQPRVRFPDVLLEHAVVARIVHDHPDLLRAGPVSGEPELLRWAKWLSSIGAAMARPAHPGSDRALHVELTADLLVTVEAGVVAACDAILLPPSPSAVRALTSWRVQRDAVRALGDALLLVEPTQTAPLLDQAAAWLRTDLALDSTARAEVAKALLLEEGRLDTILADLTDVSAVSHAYLEPAVESVRQLLPRIKAVADEDYLGDHEGVDAGLAYLLDPLSACHTAALLIDHAAARLSAGDARAATVARRWCYARVRDTTLEGLSARHCAKSRLVASGQPVPPT